MTSTTTRRGPYAKTAQKKAAVAEAALAVVLESGHRALTTAAVAAQAKMSERTMLYHFPTRDHLLVAALERSDELVERLPVDRETLLEEGLFAIPRVTLGGIGGRTAVMELYNALRVESDNAGHPAHDYFRRHYTRTLETFRQLVVEQQESGGAHPDLDPDRVARQLHGVWSGLQSLYAVDPSFDILADLDDAFRRLTGQRELRARTVLGELAGRL
ncbi:TetR family transcriptional regulator [Microbacterium sp. A8/3-1]|uniref:TetR family transcriptional regulator n=1 Tax=Microbacterium sp. A8/3-1 TaxID=3160749 RepID=A0AAU7VY28_9MICO